LSKILFELGCHSEIKFETESFKKKEIFAKISKKNEKEDLGQGCQVQII